MDNDNNLQGGDWGGSLAFETDLPAQGVSTYPGLYPIGSYSLVPSLQVQCRLGRGKGRESHTSSKIQPALLPDTVLA
jgi:hypothetical protein